LALNNGVKTVKSTTPAMCLKLAFIAVLLVTPLITM
jgi:hypothetical protein